MKRKENLKAGLKVRMKEWRNDKKRVNKEGWKNVCVKREEIRVYLNRKNMKEREA